MKETLQWPGGRQLALSLVVNVEEGSQYGTFDSDDRSEPVDELAVAVRSARNYGNESNYSYGLGAGFERVSKILNEHQVAATWTAAAVSLERSPHIARFIVDRDDEVCAHGWRWIHQYRMDEDEEREFIRRAVSVIESATGRRPIGWLSRYLHTERTHRLLVEEGFRYHMDDYSDDVPRWEKTESGPIIVVPYALDSNDMKMWTAPSLTPHQWLQYAIDTFDCLYRESESRAVMMSLGVHLRIIGRPGRAWALDAFLEHVASRDGVWFTHRSSIAEHFAESNSAP
jgi:peptidoglycan/xylan/chitin deacetylase (PgdA/CDA1 family)